MSTNLIFIIVGIALFVLGLVKLAKGQRGGSTLRNFGITFGGSTTQINGNYTLDSHAVLCDISHIR